MAASLGGLYSCSIRFEVFILILLCMKPFAFVFPGQGSQAVGMLDGWKSHPVVKSVLAEASDSIHQDLEVLIANGPKEVLDLTINTQPIMLVAGVAAWRMWRSEGGEMPLLMAGHSLGEYAALVAAGVLSLQQATPLVRLRAEAMQQAVPSGLGGMAAILGLDSALVKQGCDKVTREWPQCGVVEAVNFNDPLQTVIAGSKDAVLKACELMKEMGAKRALTLPVSAPFHSSLMRPAADQLRLALADLDIRPAQVSILSNVDVVSITEPNQIRDSLYRQAFSPVRWVETIRTLKTLGVMCVVECGPGKVLTSLNKRIDPTILSESIYDLITLKQTLETVK